MRGNIAPIVVGVDGSAASHGAVRWAADEAARHNCPLVVLHALDVPAPSGFSEGTSDVARNAAALAHGWTPAVQVETLVVDGPAADALREQSNRARLVVIGGRGLGGFAGLVLGSVGMQLSTHAGCPVLVVKHAERWAGPEALLPHDGPLVVGVDGSPASVLALELAFDEAAARHVPLVAVRAWQEPKRPSSFDPATAEAAARHALAAEVAPWQAEYPDVEVDLRVRHGGAAAALTSASEDAVMVVLGARGRGGFAGLRLGSVSQQVLQHAASPVLIARATAAAVGTAGGVPTAVPALTDRPYRRIAVAADGTQAGWTALAWACDEAETAAADLTVCRPGSMHEIGSSGRDTTPDMPAVERADPVLAEHLHAARDRLGGQCVGLEATGRGTVSALLDLAGRADLLALGAAAATPPAHLSAAARVAAHASVPVVVVPARPAHGTGPFAGHVVVGVDGSAASRAAVRFGFRYARHHRVPLAAVHVSNRPAGDFWFDDTTLEMHFTTTPDSVELLAAEVEPVAVDFPQVAVKRAVFLGTPTEGLRRAAQGAVLLVLGRHGHRLPAPLRLGSVSRTFAEQPLCAVAIAG